MKGCTVRYENRNVVPPSTYLKTEKEKKRETSLKSRPHPMPNPYPTHTSQQGRPKGNVNETEFPIKNYVETKKGEIWMRKN